MDVNRYVFAGAGPDFNEYMRRQRMRKKEPQYVCDAEKPVPLTNDDLDIHPHFYTFMDFFSDMNPGKPVGLEIGSLNTEQNMKYCFPKTLRGKHGIISFPGHLTRMRAIELEMRDAKELSGQLELYYISTKSFWAQNWKEHVHGLRGFKQRIARILRNSFL